MAGEPVPRARSHRRSLPDVLSSATLGHPVRRTSLGLVGAMILAVGAVAVLAYWDEEREAEVALEDFAEHQTITASLIAQHLRMRLVGAPGAAATASAAADLSIGRRLGLHADRPSETVLLIVPPEETTFRTEDGRPLVFAELAQALESGRTSMRVDRGQAARLGLPARTAIAGLARIGAGTRGRWGIAVVSSAERQRDREYHARARLLLAVLAAAGLVGSFGGLALFKQKKELELERALKVRELEQERDERLERLDKAVTLGTMAIGIAHEVSTPLGVIAGRAEQILARAQSDERVARATRSILEQTARINEVIRAFLRIARGDPPPVQPIAPKALVDSARALVEHRFEKAGVHLSDDVPPKLPELQGDPVLLEQALVNLLLNACEACDRGGHVAISAEDSGASVAFTVADDGTGISSEAAARATEPFFTTKEDKGGSGLGLAIVSEIVQHHGGRVAIASTSPRGTTARIEIPIVRGAHHGFA